LGSFGIFLFNLIDPSSPRATPRQVLPFCAENLRGR
jgi:hypothetical protein